ncbi:MAG: PLP-dependent aminotransferase family protein [Oscillospiraceae bacterium]|jgi:GntR family transcriptional regulator/MocR family aminotransferase|nr:PLP-dependent aminotransferase family protein [Oscillospiraceae bacterium]
MLTYDFGNKGGSPLYVYLYNCIKADILCGRLKPNEKLPSKRNLAEHLKISIVTVENSYAQLILEGYIYSVEKKGYFVSRLQETLPRAITAPQQKKEYIYGTDKSSCEFDFQSNNVSSKKFPFSIWAKLMRETLSEQDARLLEPMPYNGVEELRIAIADYLYHFRGMLVSPEQIIIGAGTEYLYNLIIQLLGRNNVFATEDPGYKKIARVYQSNAVRCEFIGMDNSGLSVCELASSGANIVHISPAHHFPTGIVMPIKRRHELLLWANEKQGRYIIEDDYDSEFRFSGRPLQTLQSIDMNEKVLYVNTFSKSIAPSMRISYMVLPKHLTDHYAENLNFYSCTVPSFEQFTLAKFIANGYFERHINRMRNYYKKQRDTVISAIKQSSLGEQITILEENAGLHFLMKVKTGMSDADMKRAAEAEGIKLSCLSEYCHDAGRQNSNVIIINYSGIDFDKVEEAIRRLLTIFQ